MIRERCLAVFFAALVSCAGPPRPSSVAPSRPPSAVVAAPPPITSAVVATAPAVEIPEANDVDGLALGGERLPLGDGAELVIEVTASGDRGGAPAVAMALVRGGKVTARRDGFNAVAGVEPTILVGSDSCDSWRGSLRREAFGSVSGRL